MITPSIACRFTALLLALPIISRIADADDRLAKSLATLSPRVFTTNESPGEMLAADVSQRLREANQRSSAAWHAFESRRDWERHRDQAVQALRRSLGVFPLSPPDLQLNNCGEIAETGYTIRKLLYSSHPGVRVTANLYQPSPPRARMPGILICHSHHAPKTQGELQEMGALWARAGLAGPDVNCERLRVPL